MAARYCPKCGAANSPSAVFCQYCGTALPADVSAPLPSSGAPGAAPPTSWASPPSGASAYGAAPYGTAPYAAPPPSRPRRRVWVWILVGLVVFILIVGVIGFLFIPSGPAINVTEITIQSSDNVCGLANSEWNGFTANASEVLEAAFNLTGSTNASGGTNACTVTSVSSATTGFVVSNASVPLTIPANSNETLTFDLTCPSASYNGVLNLSFT
jgi:hypothetical protein